MKKISEGIVLGHLKYGDNKNIVHIYTRDEGRVSFMATIPKGNNKHKVISTLLPLSNVEISYWDNGSDGMQRITAIRLVKAYKSIHLDVVKGSMSLFIAEFLEKCLKHNTPDGDLYRYIECSLEYFDNIDRYSNFHIEFLCGLSEHFGIQPGELDSHRHTNTMYWDFQEGLFVDVMPAHSNFLDSELSMTACRFFIRSHTPDINLSRSERNKLLHALIKYFSIHLDGINKINSLEVLQEVFA
ncbi:MAG: DNA repair protein RecO [Bacteroidales bacterium]